MFKQRLESKAEEKINFDITPEYLLAGCANNGFLNINNNSFKKIFSKI